MCTFQRFYQRISVTCFLITLNMTCIIFNCCPFDIKQQRCVVRNDVCKNSLLTWSLCISELFIIVTATVISRHMTFYDSSDVSRNVPHSFILMIGYELLCPSSQQGIECLNIPVTSNGVGLFDNHLAHVFNYPLFIQTLSFSLSIIQRSLLGNSTHMLNFNIAPFSICVSLV